MRDKLNLRIGLVPRTMGAAAWIVAIATLAVAPLAMAAPPSTHHDDAKALGKALGASENARLKSGATATLTPRYTPTPPEAGIYGAGGDFSGAMATQKAFCAANPKDTACAGIALGSRVQPKPTVPPSDPALAGQGVVRQPSLVLGDIASTYSTCTTGTPTLVTPASYSTHACGLDTGGWNSKTCDKTLVVVPATRMGCALGTWVGATSAVLGGGTTADAAAYCNAEADGQIRFRLQVVNGTWGVDSTSEFRLPLDTPTPPAGAPPTKLATVVLLDEPAGWSGARRVWLDVYAAGPACSAGEPCAMTLHLFQGQTVCDSARDGGACVTKEAGRLESRRTCPAAQRLGSELYFLDSCLVLGDSSCTWLRGAADTCWGGVIAGDHPSAMRNAYPAGGSEAETDVWVYRGASKVGDGFMAVTGHPDNPMASLRVEFQPPRAVAVASETWTNGCAAWEPLTPGLPRDGASSTADPLMPIVGESGRTQCVKTASVCVDGPSTRTIGGVAVSRDCWQWRNTFQCHSLAASSSCGALQAAGCSPSEALTCTSVDELGRCVSAKATYQCKTADAVYSTVSNCGAGGDFCAGGSCWDTSSPPNDGFSLAVAHMQARLDAGKDFDPDAMEIFKGTAGYCGKHAFGVKDCCNNARDLISCSDDEKKLVLKKNAGQCHLVGDYCASSTLLGCKTRHFKYCCYSGKLARIVQEQGHTQLSKAWGSARDPDCSGFSVEQFSGLDWAAIDLSEWYTSINPVPPDMATVTTGSSGRGSTSCYYGAGRCGP